MQIKILLAAACLSAHSLSSAVDDWGPEAPPPPPAASLAPPANKSRAPTPDSAPSPAASITEVSAAPSPVVSAAAPGAAPAPSAPAPATGSLKPAPWVRLPIPSADARQAQLLKLRANGLYRARKYKDACDLYAAVVRLDTGDASARNDLGICQRALGHRDSALASTRAALRIADRSLAAPDTSAWSFADLRARKTAYFNLDKLGGPMREPKVGQCETWFAVGDCPARLHVCTEQGYRKVEGGFLKWEIMRAALNRSHALFSYEEVEVPSQVIRPEMRDMEELGIDGTPESMIRWINRDSSITVPLGEYIETADPECFPECNIAGNLEKERIKCRVLNFDPCAGVIGMACAIDEEGGKDRILIGEYYLTPAGLKTP